MSPHADFPDQPAHRGRLIDARLHLLDRQLLDEHEDPVGIVDDLELSGVELDETSRTDPRRRR